MDDLIPIGEGQYPVSARELYKFLRVDTRFNDWATRRIGEYVFHENRDYIPILNPEYADALGKPGTDYMMTLAMAKELSMVEHNDRGREARLYFIACEERLKQIVQAPPRLPSHLETAKALVAALERQQLLEAKIEADAPAVEFAHAVKDAPGCHDMGEVARLLGWSRNDLFAHLRDRKPPVLMVNNLPLQRYMLPNHDYFRVIENVLPIGVKAQTLVTPKGLIWLQKIVPAPVRHGAKHPGMAIKEMRHTFGAETAESHARH
jgi:anti-repressor protein